MDGFNIVMVFAIILFARLGIRLFIRWTNNKKEDKEENNKEDEKN